MATRIRNTTTTPPPMATLSRRSRIQAICPGERPSMACPGTASGASGSGTARTRRHVYGHGHRLHQYLH